MISLKRFLKISVLCSCAVYSYAAESKKDFVSDTLSSRGSSSSVTLEDLLSAYRPIKEKQNDSISDARNQEIVKQQKAMKHKSLPEQLRQKIEQSCAPVTDFIEDLHNVFDPDYIEGLTKEEKLVLSQCDKNADVIQQGDKISLNKGLPRYVSFKEDSNKKETHGLLGGFIKLFNIPGLCGGQNIDDEVESSVIVKPENAKKNE